MRKNKETYCKINDAMCHRKFDGHCGPFLLGFGTCNDAKVHLVGLTDEELHTNPIYEDTSVQTIVTYEGNGPWSMKAKIKNNGITQKTYTITSGAVKVT